MTAEEDDACRQDQEHGNDRSNELLRQARLRTPSPQDSTRPMSQKELAEAVTTHIQRTTGRDVALDRHVIHRWECGKRRLPTDEYRAALRAVLGVATDAELGFHIPPARPSKVPAAPAAGAPLLPPAQAVSVGATVQVTVNPGTAIVLLPITSTLLSEVVPALAPKAEHTDNVPAPTTTRTS